MPLTAQMQASMGGLYTKARGSKFSKWQLESYVYSMSPANGTANDQCDICFDEVGRSLGPSAADNHDLAGGSMVDALGTPLTFVEVTGIYIFSWDANLNNLIIGNGATPFIGPFSAGTQSLILLPGEVFFMTNLRMGWPVVNTTADIFKIANAAGTNTIQYDIAIVGRSA